MRLIENWKFCFAMLTGLMVLCLSLNIIQMLNKKQFATLDSQWLISEKAKELAALYSKGNVPQDKLRVQISKLRQEVETFSKKENLVLFSRGAVLGGDLADYTEEFLQCLEAEKP